MPNIETFDCRFHPRINIAEVAADDPLVIPEILPDLRDVIRELRKAGSQLP